MEIVTPVFNTGFTILSLVVSGVLFLLWRRLFRRLFASETVVVIATAMASIITTPMLLLLLVWAWVVLTKR